MKQNTQFINKTYSEAFDLAVTLETRRDAVDAENWEEIKLNEKEEKHLLTLNKLLDVLQNDPFFHQPLTDENLNIDFSFVTIDWVKTKVKELEISHRELAIGVNVQDPQISQWFSGHRNPSGAAMAALYYFIRSKMS